MNRTAILAVLPLIFSGSTAFAQATDDGAAHLTQVFQTYLGSTAGVVTVKPNGDAYTLTLDAAPLLKMAAQSGGTASLSPLVMNLTDNGDGTWKVTQDQALSLAFSMPGAADVQESVGSLKSESVFDEAFMAFSSMKGQLSDIKITEKITQPGQGEGTVDMAFAAGTFDGTGAKGASGGVDATVSVTMSGFTGTFAGQADGGMPVSLAADSFTESVKLDGLRPDAIYKLMAWFVAHPTQDAMKGDKATLKGILTDGLPLFAEESATATIKKLAVTTPMGQVGIDQLDINADLTGVVADGKFREAFAVSGLTLPAGLVPTWAAPILPQKASFDFQVTDFDAAAAATLALGVFDLPDATPPDAAFGQSVLKALLPKGTVTIGLNPSAVTGDGYALTYEGTMVAGPDTPVPTGTAKITLTGIDKLQAALAAAPDDMKAQAMMGIGMAQGMAKPGNNGALVWEIDASTPGKVLVNGTPMMGGN